jgi:hypothetical protein
VVIAFMVPHRSVFGKELDAQLLATRCVNCDVCLIVVGLLQYVFGNVIMATSKHAREVYLPCGCTGSVG